MNDIEIQARAVTRQSVVELKKKFPGEEFDLIIRDFSPAIHIQLRKTQLSELMVNLFEEFVLDTPSAEGTLFYRNGDKLNYENTISFLRELKKVPVLDELTRHVGYDNLIPWIRYPDGHDRFFSAIKEKYTQLFTYLDYNTSVTELTNVLKAAIERKYRSDAINYYIRGTKGIEEKLLGVYDWHINNSEAWFKQIYSYMPELSPDGFQRVTVTETIPVSKKNIVGEIGGKTVKVGFYKDMNKEITHSQRDALDNMILDIDSGKLAEIRDMSLQMLIARRYIFAEAVDKVLDFEKRRRGYDIEGLNEKDSCYRMSKYIDFANHSQDYLFKLYKTFDMIPV